MWNSNHHYNILQQGAGNLEVESEESADFSQESEVSQTSQGTESSREEAENIEPWSRIFHEAENRHETQLNEGNGHSENVARIKAENALLTVYRKEIRKVLLENLQWMRAVKRDVRWPTRVTHAI